MLALSTLSDKNKNNPVTHNGKQKAEFYSGRLRRTRSQLPPRSCEFQGMNVGLLRLGAACLLETHEGVAWGKGLMGPLAQLASKKPMEKMSQPPSFCAGDRGSNNPTREDVCHVLSPFRDSTALPKAHSMSTQMCLACLGNISFMRQQAT